MQKGSFNRYSEMQNILVSHSINQAQEPLNETGIGRLHVDSKLLVALSQKKKSASWSCKYKWKDKIPMTKSQNKGRTEPGR